jgi:hypothetical protein
MGSGEGGQQQPATSVEQRVRRDRRRPADRRFDLRLDLGHDTLLEKWSVS